MGTEPLRRHVPRPPYALCLAVRSWSRSGAQVPLRRVNQAYVIATSTLVDVSSVDAAKFDDAYFLKPEKKKEQRAKKGEENFFQEDAEKTKARMRFVKVGLTSLPI